MAEDRLYYIVYSTEDGTFDNYYRAESEAQAIADWEGEMDAYGIDYAEMEHIEEID